MADGGMRGEPVNPGRVSAFDCGFNRWMQRIGGIVERLVKRTFIV